MKLRFAAILFLIFTIAISGCSFFRSKSMAKNTPEGLYYQASTDFKDGYYKYAREYFTRLKEEHPLHPLAILAELGIADSHYSDKGYAEAEIAYSDFIMLHPTNENIPYALYQMGMCHYNQMGTIDRDQSETIKARKEFERLIAGYPDSKFSLMAEKMLLECKKNLGEHEFYIGRFYFNMKEYQAALKRFETIARDYANVGLDYKTEYYISETKRKIAEVEALNKIKEDKRRAAEEKKKAAKN